MKIKQAIILAGGKGVKLRPLTFTTPKPLLPLINKPILDFIILILKNAGFTEIIITLDYLADSIKKYLDNNNFGIKITTHEIKKFNGSAQILTELSDKLDETFLVLPGDMVFDLPLKQIIEKFEIEKAKMGVIIRKEPDLLGKGAFLINNDRIQKIIFKNNLKELPNLYSDSLIYYLKKDLLKLVPKDESFDIHLDLVNKVFKEVESPHVYLSEGFWAVAGRIEPYLKSNFWLLPFINQGQYIGHNSKISPSAKLIPPYFINENCEINAGSVLGPNVIIGQDVKIENNSEIKNSIINHNCQIQANSKINFSFISNYSKLGNNCELRYLNVVSDHCNLADNVILEPGTRVGPEINISQNTVVKDFIFPEEYAISKLISFSQLNLTDTELKICLSLAESGEQSFEGIKANTNLEDDTLNLALDNLITKQIIISYGTTTPIFTLILDK